MVLLKEIISDAPIVVSRIIGVKGNGLVIVDDGPLVLLQVPVGNGPVVVSLCQVGVGRKAGKFCIEGDDTISILNNFLILFDFQVSPAPVEEGGSIKWVYCH